MKRESALRHKDFLSIFWACNGVFEEASTGATHHHQINAQVASTWDAGLSELFEVLSSIDTSGARICVVSTFALSNVCGRLYPKFMSFFRPVVVPISFILSWPLGISFMELFITAMLDLADYSYSTEIKVKKLLVAAIYAKRSTSTVDEKDIE